MNTPLVESKEGKREEAEQKNGKRMEEWNFSAFFEHRLTHIPGLLSNLRMWDIPGVDIFVTNMTIRIIPTIYQFACSNMNVTNADWQMDNGHHIVRQNV
jgi:hypothetical protein